MAIVRVACRLFRSHVGTHVKIIGVVVREKSDIESSAFQLEAQHEACLAALEGLGRFLGQCQGNLFGYLNRS